MLELLAAVCFLTAGLVSRMATKYKQRRTKVELFMEILALILGGILVIVAVCINLEHWQYVCVLMLVAIWIAEVVEDYKKKK